jgi:hypothetical protein
LIISKQDGFEYCEGVEIVHCFFEAHHASGVQDTAGKDPRLAMIRDIGFKQLSIYNYIECWVSDFMYIFFGFLKIFIFRNGAWRI